MRRKLAVTIALALGLIAGCRTTTANRTGVTSVETVAEAAAAKPERVAIDGRIIRTSATSGPRVEAGGECNH